MRRTSHTRTLAATLLAASLAFGAVACSSSDSDGTAEPTGTTEAPPGASASQRRPAASQRK